MYTVLYIKAFPVYTEFIHSHELKRGSGMADNAHSLMTVGQTQDLILFKAALISI